MTRGLVPDEVRGTDLVDVIPGPIPTALDNDADTVELNITGDCVVCGRVPDECTCTDDEGA